MSDAVVPEMARAKGLRIINLVGNPLSDSGRRQLAEALPNNITFEW